MMRARGQVLAALLPLVLIGCALSDDFAIAPAAEAVESTGGRRSPAMSAGGIPANQGGASAGGSSGGTSSIRGGNAGTSSTGGAGRATGGASSATGGASSGGVGGSLGPAGAGGEGGEPGGAEGGSDSGCIPAPELCDGVSNDCDDEIDEGAACPTDCAVQTHDGHLYALCLFADEDDWVTYAEATSLCANLGAELGSSSAFALTSIESKPENDFLKTWIVETTPISEQVMIWSGANDLDEELNWVWGQGATAKHFFDQSPDGGGTPHAGWFDDFAAGKPNSAEDWEEDCGGFDSELAWQWNDFKCSDPRLGYVCEERP